MTQALSRTPRQTVTACQYLRPAVRATNLMMTIMMLQVPAADRAATRILRSTQARSRGAAMKHQMRELETKALTRAMFLTD